MRRLAMLLFLLLAAPAGAHTTAPTNLVVTGTTQTSVSLDWAQDYVDSYSGYYVRTDGGPRVAYPGSEGTVGGVAIGSSHKFCVTIDFTSASHPDESDPACIAASTTGTAPPPLPTPSPASYPRFSWAKSTSSLADFQKMKALGFTHSMVDPNPAQLATLAQAGLRAVIWGGDYDNACFWRWNDATFTSKVNALKTSPYLGIVDYVFIADEPHIGSQCKATGTADIRSRNNLSKSLLPNVQTLVSENRTDDYDELVGLTDGFLAIKYPCSYASGCVLSKIDESTAKVKASGFTNWWSVVQSFKEPSGGYYRAPSAPELRAIMDKWEAASPNGVAAYAWGDGCCGDDIGLRDLTELQPTWLAANTVGAVTANTSRQTRAAISNRNLRSVRACSRSARLHERSGRRSAARTRRCRRRTTASCSASTRRTPSAASATTESRRVSRRCGRRTRPRRASRTCSARRSAGVAAASAQRLRRVTLRRTGAAAR